jgi:hypothetical protein
MSETSPPLMVVHFPHDLEFIRCTLANLQRFSH